MSSRRDAAVQNLLIFDDGRGRWGPLKDLRAVFDLRTGVLTTRARLESLLGRPADHLHVQNDLIELYRDRSPSAAVNAELNPAATPPLLVNGRWPGAPRPDAPDLARLTPGQALVQEDGQVVAACLEAARAQRWIASNFTELPPDVDRITIAQRVLLDRPWHIQEDLERVLRFDLSHTNVPAIAGARHRGPRHGAFVQFGDYPLHLSQHATVQPTAVFNTEQGPIVIDYDALIGAQSVVEGPCYIGPGSQVTCHTHVRPNTVLGPMCKVGGEISHSIIFGHSNKAHAGYLGHALVGEWVNLGAQTNVSNLKNTYGPVAMQLEADAPPENTGNTYLGPVIGDFVRTAIGSRLLTGSCLSTAAMLAISAFAPKHVARFAFLTDQGEARYDIDKFLATADRMMARRDLALSEAERRRLRALHANARD